MKFLDNINVKTKDELFQRVKQDKILPFFLVYQKLVAHNMINPFIYIIIIIIEYLQLFYELTNDGEEYIQSPTTQIKSTSTFNFNQVLQYINFSHFIDKNYLSYNQFIVLYIAVTLTIVINFITLIVLDIINKKFIIRKNQLKTIHAILGFFNYTNVKILIIPFSFVLIRSYSLTEFAMETAATATAIANVTTTISSSTTEDTTDGLINQLSTNTSDVLTGSSSFSGFLSFSIGIKVLSSIVILMNLYTLINTSLLFNDLDPIESKLCWAQSYPEIEMYNINLKFFLVVFNVLKGRFYFIKSIFVLVINLQRCTYRFFEWYYSWSTNKVLLIVLDFGFLFFNLLSLVLKVYETQLDVLLGFIAVSGVFGTIFYFIIDYSQKSIIGKNISEFTDERQFCELIIELIRMIKQIPKDEKSINNPTLFGYLIKHKKVCRSVNCTTNIVKSLIYDRSAIFANEIECFRINTEDFNLYCKTNKRDNYEILTDKAKVECEKAFYALIKCIIDYGISKLSKENTRFLPILEAYVYIHVFHNKFYALFQIMKYYKSNFNYREKFFFFMSLSNVINKMVEENNVKYTSSASIFSLMDFYYFNEQFFNEMHVVLDQGNVLFRKLLSMKPSAEEVLTLSISLGNSIKELHVTFQKIMTMNPYEINILRIYTFLIEKLFFMKKLAKQNRIRLTQNIKFFLMNDKFKTKESEIQSKISFKNFYENSDSGIIIVSGILDNLGEILYCNNLVTGILGYEKKEMIGFSVNNIIPQPMNIYHNDIILDFYRKGQRKALDNVRNVFALHKNGILMNIDIYVCFLPSMDFGLMFIGIFKNSYTIHIARSIIDSNLDLRKEEKVGVKQDTVGDEDTNIADTDIKATLNLHLEKDANKNMNHIKDQLLNIVPRRESNLTDFPTENCVKSMLFKAADTGLIILNKKFEILHMNSFACFNIFGLSKPFPCGKVQLKKIFRDFYLRLTELETGESITVSIDILGVSFLINQLTSDSMLYGQNMDDSFLSQTSSPKLLRRKSNLNPKDGNVKTVKIGLIKSRINISKGDFYYILTLQNREQRDNSSLTSESEKSDYMIDHDESELNQTTQTYSSGTDSEIGSSLETIKDKSIEKEKQKLLGDSYTPRFAIVSKITIYILFLIILVWLVASYIIELEELNCITNAITLFMRNEILTSCISYYVLNSLLLIRAQHFPFLNVNSIKPLIVKSMKLERENIYSIVKLLHEDTSSEEAKELRTNFAEKRIDFIDVAETGKIITESINMNLALDKLIFSMDYLINHNDSMSSNEIFYNEKFNSAKIKMFFIYQNYFNQFSEYLEEYTSILSDHISRRFENNIIMLQVIFALSLFFCIVVSFIFMSTLYNQEKNKKSYLMLLEQISDQYYDNMVDLVTTFKKSLDFFMKEDQNIHRIKQQLERDEYYRENFIRGESFLRKSGNALVTFALPGDFKNNEQKRAMKGLFKIVPVEDDNLEVEVSGKDGPSNSIVSMGTGRATSCVISSPISYCRLRQEEGRKARERNTSVYKTEENVNRPDQTKGDNKNEIKIFKEDCDRDNLINAEISSSQVILSPSKKKSKETGRQISQFLKNHYETAIQEKSDYSSSDEQEKEKKIVKAYSEYRIPWKKSILNFLFGLVMIAGYFIFSIFFLDYYFHKVQNMMEVSDLLNSRMEEINNLIISLNILFLYNSTKVSASDVELDIPDITLEVTEIEGEYRDLFADSTFYSWIEPYETNDLCQTFQGFKTSYNLISCSEFQSNLGMTFQIIDSSSYLNKMYIDYSSKEGKDITVNYLEDMFTDPKFIEIMIHNSFFGRLFLMDRTISHEKISKETITNTINVVHIKFMIYITLLLILIWVYQILLIPKITRLINNLKRVGLFFEEAKFQITIKNNDIR